jgi:dUTP pyrophosphatase
MTKYTLLVKLSDNIPESIKEYYHNFKPKHDEDSGFDLYTTKYLRFPFHPGGVSGTVEFGLSCAMVNNETNKYTAYYLYPRSSFSKYPIVCCNSVGIIDSGYRGEIKGKIRVFKDWELTNEMKLFQLCSPDLSPFDIKIVHELNDTSRGVDGFGSTGK